MEPPENWVCDFENEFCTMDIYKCSCGFHIGLDSTYIDQISEIEIECPNCNKMIATHEI